jgi:hypothetical protein
MRVGVTVAMPKMTWFILSYASLCRTPKSRVSKPIHIGEPPLPEEVDAYGSECSDTS